MRLRLKAFHDGRHDRIQASFDEERQQMFVNSERRIGRVFGPLGRNTAVRNSATYRAFGSGRPLVQALLKRLAQ